MDRTYCVTGLPFVILTHIEQNTVRILSQSLSGFFDCDLAHARARLVNDAKEIRRMLHDYSNVFNAGLRLMARHDRCHASQQADKRSVFSPKISPATPSDSAIPTPVGFPGPAYSLISYRHPFRRLLRV